jgi:predicted ATP-dependent serine protease
LRSGGKDIHRVFVPKSQAVSPGQVISAGQLAKMKFSTLSIGGRFGKLLGKPYKPFYLMIYGSRFNGKSSVAMLLADELVKGGLKVLYISNEEGVKGSLQEKLLRLKISSPIHFVEEYNPKQFRGYDAVFLDSTQTVGMKPDEFKAIKRQFPETSFILVFKANRDGSSKGGTDWEHDVDAIMHIENQSATMEKNRFSGGSNETIKMF